MPQVKLEEVIAEVGVAESEEVLRVEWERSQQSMPEGELLFLAPQFLSEACRAAYLDEEVGEVLSAVGRRAAGNRALRALAWHFHHCLYGTDGYSGQSIRDWPSLEEVLGEDGGLLYLAALLSGLPTMQRVHGEHGVPAEVTRDTILDLKLWLEGRKREHPESQWGLVPFNLWWLSYHFRGELYRLGRLQFQFGSLGREIRVFRHRDSGLVAALSEDGMRYRADGGRAGSEEDGCWVARLVAGESETTGCPILPEGRAIRREVTLRHAEWQPVLAAGQPVLYIHIPAGGPLAHDLCGQSFGSALDFFPKHFPERPFDGFCCHSWLLNAELAEFLPESANIVRFQREFYLFPIALGSDDLLWRIFDEVPKDLTHAPRDTTLRRGVLDRLLSGQGLRPIGGGCFLLPEDFNWGAQVYRRQEFPW